MLDSRLWGGELNRKIAFPFGDRPDYDFCASPILRICPTATRNFGRGTKKRYGLGPRPDAAKARMVWESVTREKLGRWAITFGRSLPRCKMPIVVCERAGASVPRYAWTRRANKNGSPRVRSCLQAQPERLKLSSSTAIPGSVFSGSWDAFAGAFSPEDGPLLRGRQIIGP